MKAVNSKTTDQDDFQALVAEKEQFMAEKAILESRIALLNRQMLDKKKERFIAPENPEQFCLEFGGKVIVVAPEDAKQIIDAHERARQNLVNTHEGRLPVPSDLPWVAEIIEPAEDTSEMTRIGEDVSAILEISPEGAWVRRIVRPRYART